MTLAGLELGLLTMKKGEFSRFLLQPQYAYGEMGCPPFIPAAAAILYEVHILDYLDSGQVDEFIAMSSVGFHRRTLCIKALFSHFIAGLPCSQEKCEICFLNMGGLEANGIKKNILFSGFIP